MVLRRILDNQFVFLSQDLTFDSPNSACTEGVLTVLLKMVLWFVCRPVRGPRLLVFAATSYTLCMSRRSRAGETFGRATFVDSKT